MSGIQIVTEKLNGCLLVIINEKLTDWWAGLKCGVAFGRAGAKHNNPIDAFLEFITFDSLMWGNLN